MKTRGGVNRKFVPTVSSLHALVVDRNKADVVFGNELYDNGTKHRKAMCIVEFRKKFVDDRNDVDNDSPLKTRIGVQDDVEESCDDVTGVMNEIGLEDAIDTVRKSKQQFTVKDQKRALRVRSFQHVAGVPSDETLLHSVKTNGVKNSLITIRDIAVAKEMLGPSLYTAKGKTTRTKGDVLDVNQMKVDLPATVKNYHMNVVLEADVMHLNNVPFLTLLSENVHYSTASAVDNLQCPTLEKGLCNIIRSYAVREFHIIPIIVNI